MKNLYQEIRLVIKDKYGGSWHPGIIKDIQQLRAEEPIDYIIGWTPFLRCHIDLSERPFIPRPETEYWTEQFLREAGSRNYESGIRILDVFSGSGCIGIATLKNIAPNQHFAGRAKVDFAELNPRFIKQIKINLRLNKLRGSVIQSNGLVKIKNKYDFILANPPYVPLKNKSKVSKEVLKYEPRAAVFGGPDGLKIIRRFIARAKNNLRPSGEVWMEFDSQEKPTIAKLIRQAGYSRQRFQKDQFGRWRWVIFGI
jgi:release factor glutamine methyltransferase